MQIGNLIDKIESFADNYPQILFPISFTSALNDIKSDISNDAILKECRRKYGDFPFLYPLIEPRRPNKPVQKIVPTTYPKESKRRTFIDFDVKTILSSILLTFLIGGFAFFALFFVFSYIWGRIVHSNQDSILYSCVTFVLLFGTLVVTFIKLTSFKTSYNKQVPYQEQELRALQQKAQEEYNTALEMYPSQLNVYEKQLSSYNSALEKQERVVMNTIPQVIALAIRRSIHESHNYTIVDEAPQRGRSENRLFALLMQRIPNAVHVDTRIKGYFPDLMIESSNNVFIDVEIDEPYEMGTKKEIHYIGGGDESRNKIICDSDWIVLRFSEKQVITKSEVCLEIILDLLAFIENGDVSVLSSIEKEKESIKEKRWTKEEARLMAINSYRNSIIK